VRLAFAMAAAIRLQVLLIDEWFLAGDACFRSKAQKRLESVVRGADILVLSTHINRSVLVHPRHLARGWSHPCGRECRRGD
jgi:lipopolysaccharide transport system ATP-binding protein